MKKKFSKILGIGLTLALLTSLLITGAPVMAAEVTKVTVSPSTLLADAIGVTYTFTIDTNVELTGDADTISIVFPSEITPPAEPTAPADVTVNGKDLDASDKYVVAGQRVTIEVPETVSATGTFDVVIGVNNLQFTNPAAGSYAVDVYTSQETTAVTSVEFVIGGSDDSQLVLAAGDVVLDDYEVGIAAEYTITLTTEGTTLAANVDTIVITFPVGTTVPASITDRSYVTISGDDLDATTDYSADGQEVTLTVPVDRALGTFDVVFTANANIINPTIVDDVPYKLSVHTSQEPIESVITNDNGDYDAVLVAGDISKLVFSASPSVIAPDEVPAQVFTVQAQDEFNNDNTADSSSVLVLTSTSLTGAFYVEIGCTTPIAYATGITLNTGAQSFYYKDATVGDYTITVAEKTPSDPPWTDATTPLSVNAALEVGLYHDGALVAYYHTIAEAITAAALGDTIEVGPGTYDGNFDLNVADLTLEATGTTAETIIDATIAGIVISADGVTVDGFTVENVENGKIGIKVTGDDATVKYNVITLADPEGWADGILLNIVDEATVEYNELAHEVTISVNTCSDAELSHNTFGGGINLVNSTDIEIIDNDLIDVNYLGIRFGNGPFTSILIEGNTISGTTATTNPNDAGIGFIGSNQVVTNLQIIRNDIINNLGPGIVIPSTVTLDGDDNVIKYNDISGNGGYGIQNDTTTTDLDATRNYWGDVTGPSSGTGAKASTAVGSGDAVSVKVTYSPWLHKSQSECVTASYPALTVSLSVGWNTLSAPAKLISTADTVGELVPSGITYVAYWYNTDTANWDLAANHPLNPCDAIYIRMESATDVLFQIDGAATWVPSQGLDAGWNMIGLANLEDKDVSDAVASAGSSYAQVASPSMNTNEWVHISGQDYDPLIDEPAMVVGEGYWIFMKEIATLGGFILCPIVPEY